jgi:hypothetical protein
VENMIKEFTRSDEHLKEISIEIIGARIVSVTKDKRKYATYAVVWGLIMILSATLGINQKSIPFGIISIGSLPAMIYEIRRSYKSNQNKKRDQAILAKIKQS